MTRVQLTDAEWDPIGPYLPIGGYVWVSNAKSRRDKLSTEQPAALRKLGIDWA